MLLPIRCDGLPNRDYMCSRGCVKASRSKGAAAFRPFVSVLVPRTSSEADGSADTCRGVHPVSSRWGQNATSARGNSVTVVVPQ